MSQTISICPRCYINEANRLSYPIFTSLFDFLTESGSEDSDSSSSESDNEQKENDKVQVFFSL